MGAENSTPAKVRNDYVDKNNTEKAIQEALERQRQMFEQKCNMIIQSQSPQYPTTQNSFNCNSVPPPQMSASTSNTVYPNIQEHRIFENNLFVQGHVQPSCVSNIHEFQFPSVVPSAPVESPQTQNREINQQIKSKGATPKCRVPPPQMSASTSNTVYPNIQEHRIFENNLFVQGHVQPSCVSNIHEFQFPSVVPSAPVESPQTQNREINQQIKSKGATPKCRGNQSNKARQSNNNNNNQSLGCVSCSGSYGMYIYQCQNGHSSCMKCKSTYKPCGICSKPITEMRNITLETLIAEMGIKENNDQEKIQCINAKDGCCLSFTQETLTDHLKECPFMDLECPLSKIFGICKWKGKVSHLSFHFNNVHPEHCIADVGKQMTLLDTEIESVIVYFIKIGAFNFLFYIKRDTLSIYMTAQLFGTKVSASKWTYEVHVYNKKNPKRKFTSIDICNKYAVPVEDIFNKGQCVIINKQYASTFFNNNELTYEFYLKNVPNNKKFRLAKTEQNA